MHTSLVSLLALAGLVMAAPSQAQEPGRLPMQHAGMQGGMGMMQGMMSGPMMILHLREPLDLTDQQVQQVEAIHAGVHPQVQQQMQQAMQLHQQAMDALMGDAQDPERHDALLRQAADQMVAAHSRMARAMVEAQQVLTPEQRDDLRFAVRAMRSMMQGMQGGMDQRMMHGQHGPGMPPMPQ